MSLLSNIQRQNKNAPPASAATVTAANNGLSLSGTTAQLGQAIGAVGDPAILINNREIPMAAFSFTMRDGANPVFIVDPDAVFPRYAIGDLGQVNDLSYLDIDRNNVKIACGGTGAIAMGDVDGYGTGLGMSIVTAGVQPGFFMMDNFGEIYFAISFLNDTYVFGDDSDNVNGGKLLIHNDATKSINLFFGIGNQTGLSIADAGGNISASSNLGMGYIIDGSLGTAQFGDVGLVNNSTNLLIDDSATKTTISWFDGATTRNNLLIDNAAFNYSLGDDNGNPAGFFAYVNAAAYGGFTTIYGEDNGLTCEFFVYGTDQQATLTAVNGLKIVGDTTLLHTGTALSNNAGAGAGTLLNAPTAGNPTKWIAIDDNGTQRFIPTWT